MGFEENKIVFELITFDGSSTWVGCICYKISNQESGPEVVGLVGPSVLCGRQWRGQGGCYTVSSVSELRPRPSMGNLDPVGAGNNYYQSIPS